MSAVVERPSPLYKSLSPNQVHNPQKLAAGSMAPLCLLRRTILLLLAPLLASLPWPAVLSGPLCHPGDMLSLLHLKTALCDPYTIVTWTAAADCCSDWADVTCDAITGRVVFVDIFNSEAAWPLPKAIGDLPNLTQLTIRESPNVTGPLPPALSKLTNLRMLWMDRNSLTGPVPAFLGLLPKLEYINLCFNKQVGDVPPALGGLPRLAALVLEMNQLTGTIPESLGRLRSPVGVDIRLGGNRLTGPVPRSFGNLNVSQIDLSRNRLTGDPSALFQTGGWTASLLVSVDLSWNQFEFDLSPSPEASDDQALHSPAVIFHLLEITLISAQDLKPPSSSANIRRLKTYTIVYSCGRPLHQAPHPR